MALARRFKIWDNPKTRRALRRSALFPPTSISSSSSLPQPPSQQQHRPPPHTLPPLPPSAIIPLSPLTTTRSLSPSHSSRPHHRDRPLRRHPVITAGGPLPLSPSRSFLSHSPLSSSPFRLPSVSHLLVEPRRRPSSPPPFTVVPVPIPAGPIYPSFLSILSSSLPPACFFGLLVHFCIFIATS
ncbi:proline-rich receptor-like protein kinase PERK2 [Arachis duranensis]|uniref:Proline-rich receptor-like protein kinase PERK2 n=1 Tax=Arachis duranensis TaxID=130453 RepID=A0A6P4BEC4_ARADU|nr:proline-rich receptor-like protein kinase PERK2 [Arachis duranensis]